MKKKASILSRIGVSGYNKPKRTPSHPKKSHVVVAKSGSTVKTIRFGQQGVSGAGKNPKTKKQKARRKSFKARHGKNIRKGVLSAAYWANRVKWQPLHKGGSDTPTGITSLLVMKSYKKNYTKVKTSGKTYPVRKKKYTSKKSKGEG